MLKYFIALVFSFSAMASMQDLNLVRLSSVSETKGVQLLKEHLEESRYLRNQTFAFEIDNNYQNGDFVILWGVGSSTKDQSITETEYKGLWRVMNYLAQKDFRVIINVRSTTDDLSDALASKTASVVLFSSHGNKSAFYDFDHKAVPSNIFDNRSSTVYQFILSACYGAIALRDNYVVPEDLKVFAWKDLTNPTELLNFLVSKEWTGLEGKKID